MKYILSLLICILTTWSCQDKDMGRFIPFDEVGAFTYLESKEEFSDWARLIRHAGLDKSMNLKVMSLTCFVVENDAVRAWLEESPYETIEDMEPEVASDLLRYHIIQGKEYEFSDFLDGRFDDPTALGYYLTTLFVDGGEVLINGEVALKSWDISVINGVIHVLEDVLSTPVATMLDFVQQDQYSIFKALIDTTSTGSLLEEEMIEGTNVKSSRSLLIVPDAIYEEAGIMNIGDLIDSISSGNVQYTENTNPLNKYARYHMLLGNYSTVDFIELAEAFHVDPEGIPLNTRAEDELIHLRNDRVNIRFNEVTFWGSNYNLQTRNGFVHELEKMIVPTPPPPLRYVYDFADPINNPTLPYLEGYRDQIEPVWMVHDLKKELVSPNITWSTEDDRVDAVRYKIAKKDEPSSWDFKYYWAKPWGNKAGNVSHGDVIMVNSAKDEWVEFQLPSIPKGEYKVILSYMKIKGAGGNFQIYLDGQPFGSARVGWLPPAASHLWPHEEIDETITFTETKSHTFKCVYERGGETNFDVVIFDPIEE